LIGQCPTREKAGFPNAKSAPVVTNTGPYGGSRYPQRKWVPRNTSATVSLMTVDTGSVESRENPTAACSHVAIDDTTMVASAVSNEASNPVHGSARDTDVVPDGPIILHLAELNFIDLNIGGDDHTLWRGLDDAGSEVNVVSRDRLVSLGIPYKPMGSITLRQVAGPPIQAELVSLPLRVANPVPGAVNHTEYLTIMAASCGQMTHDRPPFNR